MMITMLLGLVGGLLNLFLIIDLPNLPPQVLEYLESMFEYIEAGAGILANYTPLAYLLTLFGIVVAVDAGILIYRFVLWVLKKIPAVGIE